MDIYTFSQCPSPEGTTFSVYRNGDEEVEDNLSISQVYHRIHRELERFVDDGLMNTDTAFYLASDWIAYNECMEGLLSL